MRALGVRVPYAVVVALGGSTEDVGLSFKHAGSGHETWFVWYVALSISISVIVYFAMPEARGCRLDMEGEKF